MSNSWQHAIRGYYLSRQFSKVEVEKLIRDLDLQVSKNLLHLTSTGIRINTELLAHHFSPIDQNPQKDLSQANAIFALAFGYRLKSRPVQGIEARLPGENNQLLAQVVHNLLTQQPELKACPQMEITDALKDRYGIDAYISSPAADIGTKAVINSFVRSLGWKFFCDHGNKVIVVAHQHHIGRCLAILKEDYGLEGLVPPGLPITYDTFEAQPRVKNEAEFLYSDFISMISRVR